MSIQGLRTTANFVADQRPKNWRETILMLYPNGKMPLTALTSMMKTTKTDDPEFNWWTKALSSQRLTVTTALGTTDTTVAVAGGGALQLKDGHLLRVEQTDEILLVNGDPSVDNQINVVRGYSGSTAAALAIATSGVNPNIHVIGSAHEEGSLAPTGINYDPTKLFNYTQIFRNTLEATRTAAKTRLRTGDQIKEAKRECLEMHGVEIEKGLILGKRWEGTRNGKPIRTTGGVISYIDSNNIINNNGTAVTMAVLEGWLEQMFRYGSSEKFAMMGNMALLAINQAVRKNSQYNIQGGLKEFGMNVSRLISPFGELVMKTHPLFNQIAGGTNTTAYYGMNSWMLVLDMDNLHYRPFDGADTQYEKDLQANGMDGMKSGYLTEAGLEIHHPLTHFLIKGMVSGAVDA